MPAPCNENEISNKDSLKEGQRRSFWREWHLYLTKMHLLDNQKQLGELNLTVKTLQRNPHLLEQSFNVQYNFHFSVSFIDPFGYLFMLIILQLHKNRNNQIDIRHDTKRLKKAYSFISFMSFLVFVLLLLLTDWVNDWIQNKHIQCCKETSQLKQTPSLRQARSCRQMDIKAPGFGSLIAGHVHGKTFGG